MTKQQEIYELSCYSDPVEALADKFNICKESAKKLIFHIDVIDLMEKIIIDEDLK